VRCISLVNRSDSLSVLATGREALVNVNDALHCYDADCIDYYCGRIRSLLQGRRIDYLFCGFGGASYFPNCLRHPAKDDRHVAMLRERHLAEGFARVVRNLQPRMAFAFAANLVLLDPVNHWINQVKFHNDPVALAEQEMPSMRGSIFKLSPGDSISGGELRRASPDLSPEAHIAAYQQLYAAEIAEKRNCPTLSPSAAAAVLDKMKTHILERLNRVGLNNLSFDWAVRLRDCPDAILRVTRRDGALEALRLEPNRLADVRDMVVDASSEILLAGLVSTWGGDSLQIGYGALFHLRSDESVRQNHTRQFLRLATRLPLQSDYLRLSPGARP
jgi:hypothetical protein